MRGVPVCAALLASAVCASPSPAQGRLPPPVADSGLIDYDDEGLRIHSADGRRQLKIRGYLAADARFLLSDTSDAPANTLAIRRSRLLFDVNMNPWLAFRLLFDIAVPAGPTPLADAYVDIGLPGTWWIRAGKQKTPVGLERYFSISTQLLPERSIASNLNASRDEGLLLTGRVVAGTDLSVGVFNGAPDGATTQDADANDAKDYTYRLWFHPLRRVVRGAEQGIGMAFNGSTGIEHGSASAGSQLPTFKTPAQLIFFGYNELAGVRAAGRHSRSGLLGYAFFDRWGLTAEWAGTSQQVVNAPALGTVPVRSWLLTGQYVLTGEASSIEGIGPAAPFDPGKGHWGAFQLGARAATVAVGREAFPLFADSTVAAREATELGVALNWYITRATKAQFAYEHTVFGGGARVGDRRAERYIQIRWQAYF
jgi:phosphate-selective porin OprO/OprP